MSSEETPVEQPPAEETPTSTEETPATTETTEPAADDQPAVTEVTEVTETPAAAEATSEEPKIEEKEERKEEKKKEVKQKPKKQPKAAPDYRTSKAGWVQKQGLLFKKWQRQYMSLDEEDSVLRWWKTENRTSSDGALFMKYCADVSEPKAEATTTWPDDTADRCFVICSPYRAYFLVAESPEEKNDWKEKLLAAKEKYNTEGRKLITTALISVEGIKASIDSGAADLEKTTKKEGIVEEKKTEKTEETAPAEGETAPTETEGAAAAVTVEVEVEAQPEEPPKEETPAEEPPKEETPAEEPPKEETPAEEPPKEETPAEEPPKEETPVEEPPKEETPAEEPPKEETPAEEPPKEETPAEEPPKDETPAAEGGEETKAED